LNDKKVKDQFNKASPEQILRQRLDEPII